MHIFTTSYCLPQGFWEGKDRFLSTSTVQKYKACFWGTLYILFICYFRKIVIETTVLNLQFHLLMLADVVIAFAIGSWMYKKYNHRFLYNVGAAT